jgi:putative SOS response-associated peptidase YedK
MQKKLFIAPDSSAMQMHQVSTLVNSPATDHPDLIRPVGGEQASLF